MDTEVSVVCDAVSCLSQVATHLRKRSLLAAAAKVAPLLQHPSPAVRAAGIGFMTAAAQSLPPADVAARLARTLGKALGVDPLDLTGEK